MPFARIAERSGTLQRTGIQATGTFAQIVKGEEMQGFIQDRTTEWLYELGKKKLTPGKEIRIRHYGLTRQGAWQMRGQRRGTVIACYKYHFLCETANGKRECFRYNQMFGTEEVRVHP